MIKIKLDSFLLIDVDHKTVFLFKNQNEYAEAVAISSRFRLLDGEGRILPAYWVDELMRALAPSFDFYLVSPGSQMILLDWEIARHSAVFTSEE